MPQIPFGEYKLSRLIAGSNTRYFTPEQVQSFFQHCEELGVNAYQASKHNLDAYTQYLEQGGTLNYLSLWRDDPSAPGDLQRLAAAGTVGVA